MPVDQYVFYVPEQRARCHVQVRAWLGSKWDATRPLITFSPLVTGRKAKITRDDLIRIIESMKPVGDETLRRQ